MRPGRLAGRRLAVVGLPVCAVVLLVSSSARAVCADPTSPAPLATYDKLSGYPLAPPSTHPILGRTLVVGNSWLHILNSSTLAQACSPVELGGDVQNSPTPVQLDDGSWAVFLTAKDGMLYKIDPYNCTKEWQVSFPTSDCTTVELVAAPVVHLRGDATDAFKGKYLTDVVYVSTRRPSSCSNSTSTNEIHAVRATDGASLWKFGGTASVPLDMVSQAGFLDLDNDMLYIGSESNWDTQDSLWAFDVLTGARVWSTAAGALQVTPMVVDDRVYVGTMTGEVRVLSKDDGAELWSVTLGAAVTQNVFPEGREPFKGVMGVVDGDGVVNLVRDDDETGTVVWSENPGGGTVEASSRVAMDPSGGKLYVGGRDGRLYQMRLVDGATEVSTALSGGGTIGDPSFFFDNYGLPSQDVRMIVGTSKGYLNKLCTPWASTIPTSAGMGPYRGVSNKCATVDDCGPTQSFQCQTMACVDRVCSLLPADDGKECSDKNDRTPVDLCLAGTCRGFTDCDLKLDQCVCANAQGEYGFRSFPPKNVKLKLQSTCVPVDSTMGTDYRRGARSVATVQVTDSAGRPLRGADVAMMFVSGGNMPRWRHPVDDTILQDEQVTTAAGTVRESTTRAGTYYAVFSGPLSGVAAQGITLQAIIKSGSGSCLNTTRFATVRVAAQRGASTGTAFGGCRLQGTGGERGFLRVKVIRGDTGGPAVNAPVMVGHALDSEAFYSTFARVIDPAEPPGDTSNLRRTDANGEVEFRDYGDRLNGPNIVTAGFPDQKVTFPRKMTISFSTVSISDLGAGDVTIVLPVATTTDREATHRYSGGGVTNWKNSTEVAETRMALVSQRRGLDFYAGLDPAALFDVNVCAAGTKLVPENAYLAPKTITPTIPEEPWDKTFTHRTNDTLQASYLAAANGDVFSAGEFNVRSFLLKATYEQIGFRFNENITADLSGVPVILGAGARSGTVSLSASWAPFQTDRVGLTLTDYSTSTSSGRGAGDMFVQAHAALPWDNGAAVAVPFFNLDDSTLDNNGYNISNANTWNIAALTAQYLMDPPCGQAGEDARCGKPEITKSMRTGRSTVLQRSAKRCDLDAWLTSGAFYTVGPFPRIVDLGFTSTPKGDMYEACPGGQRDARRNCVCALTGTWNGSTCFVQSQEPLRPLGFNRHTVSLKRTTYTQVDGACTTQWQPSVARVPYWIIYAAGGQVFLPDLPSDFPRACGGVSGAPACAPDQRSTLLQRSGSGASCFSDSQCKSGEYCRDLNGTKRCVWCSTSNCMPALGMAYRVDDYEWRADRETVDEIIGGSCQVPTNYTPCQATTEPVSYQEYGKPAFDGPFDFAQTKACLSARSSNELIVN